MILPAGKVFNRTSVGLGSLTVGFILQLEKPFFLSSKDNRWICGALSTCLSLAGTCLRKLTEWLTVNRLGGMKEADRELIDMWLLTVWQQSRVAVVASNRSGRRPGSNSIRLFWEKKSAAWHASLCHFNKQAVLKRWHPRHPLLSEW